MVWKNINAVENRLFLGNIMAARSTRSLAENRITHILSVCPDPIPAELPEAGIVHQRINIEDVDYADLLIHLPAACRFIEQALASGGVVLVHCVQGISRSAAVVAAYLMYSRRINSTQALNIVRTARDHIWPNPGFQEQLVLFELCQYAPSRSNGIYVNWRTQLERRLRAAGLPY
ncbi:Dual specificity protein phosphatase 1B [Psilocybe cubensis]|uniref:Dual specificity protein phosphatase 1B n=2 Tax=Psilocybe cubensis TaxID=181762 RepID=A0ACB8H4I2_PSICU|nr:Dual specificity protein phosphatase 1B [Psilocybe cubensis]KAH9482754.1 Dual specificity protein phosphatase 1B [Psilocybe cubensis]